MPEYPTDTEVEAAARKLYSDGVFHRWFPESAPTYDDLDPIGKEEFDAIVEGVLMAAAAARASYSP